MEAILRFSKDEIDVKVLEKIITLLPADYIELKIKSIDETDYLLNSEENKEKLLKSLNEYKNKEFVIKSIEDLEKLASD